VLREIRDQYTDQYYSAVRVSEFVIADDVAYNDIAKFNMLGDSSASQRSGAYMVKTPMSRIEELRALF